MIVNSDFRIIIIDDNPAIHADFIKILTLSQHEDSLDSLDKGLFGDEGSVSVEELLPKFQIDTASQGQEGLLKIKQALAEGKPYSLAFVDIRMPPGWDGVETIKHLWEFDPDLQIVICTAYSDYSWEDIVKQLGAGDNLLILKKPFDNIAVRQFACALTKKWQLLQEKREYTLNLEQRVKERTHSLQQSLSVTRATLESSADGILVVDNLEKIVEFNNKFVEMWKIPQSVLDTKNNRVLLEYMANELQDSSKFLEKMKDLENKMDSVDMDTIKLSGGNVFEYYSQPHKLNGEVIGRVWSYRDITRRVYLESQLEYQVTHDALTDLPNRILLGDRINQAIGAADRNKTSFGILFFDLDRFKLVNDSLSHEAGDELLKQLSDRLRNVIRETDTLARLGGDELVMIVSDLVNEETIILIVYKLLETIKKPFMIWDHEIHITASIGISIYPKDGKTINELLRSADLAMYLSKGEKPGGFQFYTKDLNEKSLQRLEKENELRQAIINEEFFLEYQPQFDLKTENLVAVEALVRWRHPTKGIIVPIDFIPLAEDSRLIIPIGEWVLRTACKQNKAWQEMGLPPILVAVNVAGHQLNQYDFVDTVLSILKETGLEAKFLEIELTENIVINNPKVEDLIGKLVTAGVRVAFDDFGTGNSSLNYLRKMPIDQLKIDQSFVKNINLNKNDEIIIRAIISMANSLNLKVVAEGVETKEQLDFLKLHNCEDVQGFYFSHPLLANDLEAFLREYIIKHAA